MILFVYAQSMTNVFFNQLGEHTEGNFIFKSLSNVNKICLYCYSWEFVCSWDIGKHIRPREFTFIQYGYIIFSIVINSYIIIMNIYMYTSSYIGMVRKYLYQEKNTRKKHVFGQLEEFLKIMCTILRRRKLIFDR